MHLDKMFALANSTSCIRRYSQSHLNKSESVLEHTGFVCFLSLAIGLRLKELGEPLDLGQLLARAAIHDIDEVITGDIPKTTKYASQEIYKSLHGLERENMQKLAAEEFGSDQAFNFWLLAKDESPEGLIVRLVDSLAVVYKAQQEVEFGNRSLLPFVRNVETDLYKLEEKAHLFDKRNAFLNLLVEAKTLTNEVLDEN